MFIPGLLVEALYGGLDIDVRESVLAVLCGLSLIKGNEQALLESMIAPYLCEVVNDAGKDEAGAGPKIALETLWNITELAGPDAVSAQLNDDCVVNINAALRSVTARHSSTTAQEFRNDIITVICLLLDNPDFAQRFLVGWIIIIIKQPIHARITH